MTFTNMMGYSSLRKGRPASRLLASDAPSWASSLAEERFALVPIAVAAPILPPNAYNSQHIPHLERSWDVLVEDLAAPKYSSDVAAGTSVVPKDNVDGPGPMCEERDAPFKTPDYFGNTHA